MAPGLGPWRPDMAPYVDQSIAHGVVALGLEWHPKMLLRTMLSGSIINPYDTFWWPQVPQSDVDYWLGGLVVGGVAPQLAGWSDNASTVANIRTWLERYARYGHMTEDGIHSLYYDRRCCHVDGVCEWVACEDVVLSVLKGGQTGGPVAGLYGGSSRHVVIAPECVPNGTVLLVFRAAGVPKMQFDIGAPGDTLLTLSLMSDAAVVIGGGFWRLDAQNVVQTIKGTDGSVLSRRPVFSAPVTGQMQHEVSGLMGQSIVFQKVPAYDREANFV